MRRSIVLILAVVAVCMFPGNRSVAAQAAQYVGTTPCGDVVRGFVGGLPADQPCHSITWRLSFSDDGEWTLAATYRVPAPSDPNLTEDGPAVNLEGPLDTTPDGYRMNLTAEKALTFRRVSDALIHFTSNDALMVGTGGWSYTLNRSDVIETAGNPSAAPEVPYEFSPRAEGNTVFGIFEGRTPCARIAAALSLTPEPGCLTVQWRVTLFQEASTGHPARYKVEGSLHRTAAREGTWRIERGTPSNPNAVFYQLDGSVGDAPMLLLRGDDKVLFFLDQQNQVLVGNRDFGYTLNR